MLTRRTLSLCALAALAGATAARSAPPLPPRRFDFGDGASEKGFVKITPQTLFTEAQGYGFLPGPSLIAAGGAKGKDFCTSDKPIVFAVLLDEGNWRVRITLGDSGGPSGTVVKSEARRVMLPRVRTERGEVVTKTFTVNVRRPELRGGGSVAQRGKEPHPDWDNLLTLEFGGARPCVVSLEIAPAPDTVTVFLAGDSTVTNQIKEPFSAWGQVLPAFFTEKAAVANLAESGRALHSFAAEKRLQKIEETIKAGDYLFVQFTHNDQKAGASFADPFTTFQERLKTFADVARKAEATPVFVTPMYRRRFDEAGKMRDTMGDYPPAMRQLALKEKIPLIDLHAMSKIVFEALGPEPSKRAFVHVPAGVYPGQTEEIKDDTHFSDYGAYLLARCVVNGIREARLPLARLLYDTKPWEPSRPESGDGWSLPTAF